MAVLACLPLASLPLRDAWRSTRLAEDGMAATQQAPGGFRGLRLAGALSLQARQLAPAENLLRRALALSPMDAESWRLLAAVDRAGGQADRQLALLHLAGRLTWRDAPTQRRLMLAAFQEDRLATGVAHADALLRLAPDDQLALAALLTAMDYDDGRTALAGHLAAAPAWRKRFFTGLLLGDEEDAQGLVALLQQMRSTTAPPTPEESGIAVSKLVQAGHASLALAFWRVASGQSPTHDFANDDPDFVQSLPRLQAGEPGAPFGWMLAGGAGVQVGNGRDAAGRPALTFGGPPDGMDRVVTRTVLLAPGDYRLFFSGAADGRPTARFRPRFTCATDGRALSFDTQRPTEADGYLLSRVAVTVPATCNALALSFGLSPGDDGQMHDFALRQVHWSRPGA